jgi:hypothetical protein
MSDEKINATTILYNSLSCNDAGTVDLQCQK